MPRPRARRVAAALALAAAVVARDTPAAAEPVPEREAADSAVAAPAWRPLQYAAPEPHTYDLPPLGPAADGDVLDVAGVPRRLHEFMGDKLVVLSFIYTTCPDANACPMATYVLKGIQQRVAQDPVLRDQVRLVSLSFNPAFDRPAVMRDYAARVAPDGSDWQFFTTDSQATLDPILAAYGQSIRREYDADGEPLPTISHILRVYLIDRARRIRNIYTTSFLHVDTVWSDIQTIATDGTAPQDPGAPAGGTPRGAGDDKSGYERSDYRTRSRRLDARRGAAANLMHFYTSATPGLPPSTSPGDNPMTPEKVALGRKLFYDRRLSHNDTISCAMCHIPEQGFTSNELATAVGIEGRTVRRNAPTIYNVGFAELLFHDGRENRLEQQVWGPLLAANEMGNPSIGQVLDTIGQLADYAEPFERAFGGRGTTMETVGMALACYERTLVSGNSPFDRWYYGGDADALSPAAARGFELFTGSARCASCHRIGESYALFMDQKLHNTGVGYRQSMHSPVTERRVPVGPGTFLSVDLGTLGSASEQPPSDLGRYEVTGRPEDRWAYKTPGLRNVAVTAPYMHDGSIGTLREVVAFYAAGGIANEGLDPLIQPLTLSEADAAALVAFLESLSGDNIDVLVADAFAAPIGDPH